MAYKLTSESSLYGNFSDLADFVSLFARKCIILVLFDFAHAYGSVDHDILLQVIKAIGVTENSLKWFKSFLTNWQHFVKLDSNRSEPMPITRGIYREKTIPKCYFHYL